MNGSSATPPPPLRVLSRSSSLASLTAHPPPPPLDLSLLTDEDAFESESSWLNDLLTPSTSTTLNSDGTTTTTVISKPDTSLVNLDVSLARVLAQLDVATHDTSSLVDRTIDDISRSVPRLTFDLQLMRENALLLRFTLDAIRKRAGTGGAGPGLGEDSEVLKVMEKLRVLDLVKARMEAARDVLREAESWSTLESEVTALVGEQAYAKAAERLEEAARSMVVFQNTTEYEGRRALMVSLQNQLEASLSASLVVAINTRDVKACKSFYAIFGQIQREAEFTSYYFGSRRAALVQAWSSAVLEDIEEKQPDMLLSSSAAPPPPPPAVKFSPFLTKFYSDLHSLLNEEQTYVPTIFPDPLPTLSSFIQTTLEGLSPSLPQRLSGLADTLGPQVLPELIQAYRAAEEFALMVDRIMAKLSSSTSTPSSSSQQPSTSSSSSEKPLPPPSTPSKRDRRLSKRMSISKRIGNRSISYGGGGGSGSGAALMSHLGLNPAGPSPSTSDEEPLRPWETAIFEPFLDWQIDYPELERQYIASEVAKHTQGKNLMEYLVTGEGSERGLFEHTLAVFGFAEDAVGRSLALTHGYAAVGLVQVVDDQLVTYFDTRRSELLQAKKRERRGGVTPSRPEDEDDLVLEGLEYSHADWGSFQAGLRLLDTCRSISERLGIFEAKLKSRLTTLAQAIKDARNDPVGYTIPGTTRGAVMMLRQSTLNSNELAGLLGPLEKAIAGGGSGGTGGEGSSYPFGQATAPHALLPRAKSGTTELTKATQLFLHETLLAPLVGHLREYASLPVFSTSDQKAGGKGAFDLSIPTFSLSPTEAISRVGEGLFNLPRLFEVYAANDALAFSIETLPFVDAEILALSHQPAHSPTTARPARMAPFGGSANSNDDVPVPSSPSLGTRRAPPPPPPSAPIPTLSAEEVIATWLSSLTLSILSHLTTSVLPAIPRLSRHGAAQLASDLWYICNVAKALDVDAPEDLVAWREAVEVEEGVTREEPPVAVGEKAVFDRVARLRGWRK